MRAVFPNVYAFPVEGTSYFNPQNVEILAANSAQHLTEADFERLAASGRLVRIPEMEDYVTNYLIVPPNRSPILTDDYAPVENLISPINEQPLTTDEQPFMSQSEAFRVAVGASVVVVVCIILARKRLL